MRLSIPLSPFNRLASDSPKPNNPHSAFSLADHRAAPIPPFPQKNRDDHDQAARHFLNAGRTGVEIGEPRSTDQPRHNATNVPRRSRPFPKKKNRANCTHHVRKSSRVASTATMGRTIRIAIERSRIAGRLVRLFHRKSSSRPTRPFHKSKSRTIWSRTLFHKSRSRGQTPTFCKKMARSSRIAPPFHKKSRRIANG